MYDQRTFPSLYPQPSRSLLGCTPDFSVRLDVRSVPHEIRNCVVRTPPQTSVSTLVRLLVGSAGLSLSGCPTALPHPPASVFLPASQGWADTSHFRELRALPTNALSGSRASPSLSCRLFLPLLYCSLLALVRSACSRVKTPLPSPFRRIFHGLVLGTARRSELRPQASPVALVRQSLYPRISAFLVHSSICSLYSSFSLFSPSRLFFLFGTMASADPYYLSLLSQAGLPPGLVTGLPR